MANSLPELGAGEYEVHRAATKSGVCLVTNLSCYSLAKGRVSQIRLSDIAAIFVNRPYNFSFGRFGSDTIYVHDKERCCVEMPCRGVALANALAVQIGRAAAKGGNSTIKVVSTAAFEGSMTIEEYNRNNAEK